MYTHNKLRTIMMTKKRLILIVIISSMMMISSLVSALCCRNSNNIEVVLQFDGSFRPPKDEPGYTRLPCRMAVCSSSIYIIIQQQREQQQQQENYSNNDDEYDPGADDEADHNDIIYYYYPLSVGSCSLPIPIEMTSAHAEYEGLILGLNRLLLLLLVCNDNDDPPLSQSPLLSNDKNNNITLKIQGDCKTVIDQINGKSKPRKLEKLYHQAMDRINMLMNNNNDNQLYYNFSSLVIDHIPRTYNHVSDNLCGNHMLLVAFREYETIINDLESLKQKQQQQQQTLSEIFNRCVTESSLIKYSIRPILYLKIASIAEEMKDYDTLRRVGEQLVLESSSRFVVAYKHKQLDQKNKHIRVLKRVGVQYQVCAMKCLGLDKKASVLERKHRVLLSKMNNNDEVVDDDDAPNAMMTNDATSIIDLQMEESVVSPFWDESIRPEWNHLLNRWWHTLRDTGDELLTMSEGCPVWIDNDNFFLNYKKII